jgi:hypothetical protein
VSARFAPDPGANDDVPWEGDLKLLGAEANGDDARRTGTVWTSARRRRGRRPGDGHVRLLEVAAPGRRRMPGRGLGRVAFAT